MTNTETKYPNFFIVGAPKCGTTSLVHYLQQSPNIFFAPKEIHFFGRDLQIVNQLKDTEKYLNYFNKSTQPLRGDASVWYLYSRSAPQEIKQMMQNPKIIICLRHPVEMIHSLHSENLYNADENEKDFEKALALEYSRTTHQNIPLKARFEQCLFYKQNGLYSGHIERWLKEFGKENVHFVLLNELRSNALETTNDCLKFLGEKPLENMNSDVKNEGKSYGSLVLHQKFKTANNFEKNIIRFLLPSKKLRKKILDKIYQKNIHVGQQENMSNELRSQLLSFFKEDIKKTSELIDKNLNHWLL